MGKPQMHTFTIENKPEGMPHYQKTATVQLIFVPVPFIVETQEGPMVISPYTVDDWDEGYYVAYPDDGSEPYSISPAFVKDNYERIAVLIG